MGKKKVAVLFQGQKVAGSKEKLTKEVIHRFPGSLLATFDEASAVLGPDIEELYLSKDPSVLQDTYNAQVLAVTEGIACWRWMLEHEEIGIQDIDFVLGHSVAQVTAYFAAGILESSRDMLYVTGERASAIKVACNHCPGKMVVLTTKNRPVEVREVKKLCEGHNSHVVIGNYNTEKQIVITGYPAEAVEEIGEQCVQQGYVDRWRAFETGGGAYHSPAMEEAEGIFAEQIDIIPFCYPRLTLIANTTAKPLKNEKEAREELIRALTGEVLWQQSQRYLVKHNTRTFIVMSPEEVLCRMAPQGRRRRKIVSFAIGAGIVGSVIVGGAAVGGAVAWHQWREAKKKEKESQK